MDPTELLSPPKIRRIIRPRRVPPNHSRPLVIWLCIVIVLTTSSSWLLIQGVPLRQSILFQKQMEQKEVELSHRQQRDDSRTGTPISRQHKQSAEGVRSQKPASFFRALQEQIDHPEDPRAQCHRYGFTHSNKTTQPSPRRIFLGSLIAEESWELLEIVATETYGIFAGVVFVESNRTQNTTPRPWKWSQSQAVLQDLFGTPNLQIRRFVQEDALVRDLMREHLQRQEILRAWREMGMQPNDIGLLGDVDESFTRDFLRALQNCDGIDFLNYTQHQCHDDKATFRATSRVWESSPECITNKRIWYHPDLIQGHCLEEITTSSDHPKAKRYGYFRQPGYGKTCFFRDYYGGANGTAVYSNTKTHPLWNAADIRRSCIQPEKRRKQRQHANNTTSGAIYNAFHLHNFFANFATLKRKYQTYGHAKDVSDTEPLEQIHNDVATMVQCLEHHGKRPGNSTPSAQPGRHHLQGGFAELIREGGIEGRRYPFLGKGIPLYFMDEDYRRRKHDSLHRQHQAEGLEETMSQE